MKTSIFVRIQLATLLPLVLIFSLVVVTINKVIYTNGANFAREIAAQVARQMSGRLAAKMENASSSLELAATGLSNMDLGAPGAREKSGETLRMLLAADPLNYCAWFAFESGVFGGPAYNRTLLQKDGEIREIDAITPEILANPQLSPWYNYTRSTGKVYLNVTSAYDYGQGEGPIVAGTITYPIFSGSRVVGCIGMDIRYEEVFAVDSFRGGLQQKLLLLSSDGTILYSSKPGETGQNLLDGRLRNQERLADTLRRGTMLLEEGYSPGLGKQALMCLYPVTIAGQTIFLYQAVPLDELYTSSRASIQIIVTTSVLGLFLVAFSVFCATRNIVRPIKRLTVSFNKVANGELDGVSVEDRLEAQSSGVVELNILQDALHKMLGQIAQAHELSLRSAEAKLEKEKILASAEAKNRFFANISHEIRTPMNAILGISEIMLHDGALTEQQRKYVSDIKVSSDALLTIINDILDLSKLESGKMELTPVPYSFPALVDSVASIARYLAEEKDLEFRCEIEGEMPLCLFGDDVRLRQVLLNLLSNAVKFTARGSVVLRVIVGESRLLFSVADTGVGIKAEDLPFLFEPFKQLDPTRNRRIQGTGLGLPICRSLLELMGGGLEMESAHGKGSVFYVAIPKEIGDASCLQPKAVRARVRYGASARVLIVDDNEINLHVAFGLLKTLHGIESELALSGAEALEKIRSADYDLIFMDHMMPEMDGVETVKLIRAMGGKYADIPVVALTANAVIGTREMLLAAGMDDFLVKPVRKERLEEALLMWMPEDKIVDMEPEGDIMDTEPGAVPPAGGTAEAPLPGFMDGLAALEELDPAVGLDAVAGRHDVYMHSLRLLRDRLPGMAEKLERLCDDGEVKNLAIAAHALKSALASVGAVALARLARNLEEASLSENLPHCRELSPPLVLRLRDLAGRLAALFKDGEEAAPAETDKARGDEASLAQDLQNLRGALERHDYECINAALAALLSLDYGRRTDDALAAIRKHVAAFEYDVAARLLDAEFPQGG